MSHFVHTGTSFGTTYRSESCYRETTSYRTSRRRETAGNMGVVENNLQRYVVRDDVPFFPAAPKGRV
jgi:hypothetical protein